MIRLSCFPKPSIEKTQSENLTEQDSVGRSLDWLEYTNEERESIVREVEAQQAEIHRDDICDVAKEAINELHG